MQSSSLVESTPVSADTSVGWAQGVLSPFTVFLLDFETRPLFPSRLYRGHSHIVKNKESLFPLKHPP